MKKMSEIKKMTDTELASFLAEKREEIRSSRFKAAGAQNTRASDMRSAKKDIARALTESTARAKAQQ